MYKLYGRPGWGSVLVEAQLVRYGLPHTIEDVDDLFASAPARQRLAEVNPLAQLPTLILPDGSVMTESAAITLHLAETTSRAILVPPPGDALRPAFLRWLVFLVTNIYPTFTYADDPARFVETKAAQAGFRNAVDDHCRHLWRIMEAEASRPWFLGGTVSALDIYIAAMTQWRPGRAWFQSHCPKLHAIAVGADAMPELAAVWARNFPADAGAAPD